MNIHLSQERVHAPEEKDAAYLWEMREAARDAQEIGRSVSREELASDKRTLYALDDALSRLGRYAGRVSREVRRAHPEVPWASLAGFAEASGTRGLPDADLVWTALQADIPGLAKALDELIPLLSGD